MILKSTPAVVRLAAPVPGKNMNKSVSIYKVAVLLSSVLLALITSAAQGEIRFAKIFSKDAVLQREVPIHLWGWTAPHASVSVQLHDQTVPAVANRIGRWDAWFAPEQAGGPFTLTAKGPSNNDIATVTDLLIGDVCQSPLRSVCVCRRSSRLRSTTLEVCQLHRSLLRMRRISRPLRKKVRYDFLPSMAWSMKGAWRIVLRSGKWRRL